MSKSNVKCAWALKNQADEVPVPLLLRITLYASRALGVAPVRFRRTRNSWRLTASPPLATLQRFIAVIVNIMCLPAVILDFQLEAEYRVRVGTTVLAGCMCTMETGLAVLTYSLGVSAATRIGRIVSMLREIHEIKTSLNHPTIRMKYARVKHRFLIFYITWQIVTCIFAMCKMFYTNLNGGKDAVLVASLWVVPFYQGLASIIIQLQWSIALVEIYSVHRLINDQLERLVKKSADTGPSQSQLGLSTIRVLNLSYDTICELLKQLNDNYGAFLCSYFLLLFMVLLITPFNLMVGIELKDSFLIAEQTNWNLLHLTELVILVEPCHWLQQQKDRTRRLLSALARKASRRHILPPLKPFILELQMLDFPLALCDVITISRPVLASVIGGVATYLIIIVQFQSATEPI